MKKNVFSLMLILLSMMLCVGFTSCNKDDDDDDKPPYREEQPQIQTGKLVITNATSDTYMVKVGGDNGVTIPGGYVWTKEGVATGIKSVYAEQLTGYVLYPTKYTYAPIIKAGETTYIVIKD